MPTAADFSNDDVRGGGEAGGHFGGGGGKPGPGSDYWDDPRHIIGGTPEAHAAGRPPKGGPYLHVVYGKPRRRAYFPLGLGAPQISGGLGGWEEIERPGNISMTGWTGQEPFRMTVPLMFNGFASGRGRDRWIAQLRQLGRPKKDRKKGYRPPVLRLHSKALPLNGKRWVLEDIDWGAAEDVILGKRKGKTLRQACVVTFLEWQSADTLEFQKPETGGPARAADPFNRYLWDLVDSGLPGPLFKIYTVRSGADTLRQIAKKFYGNTSKWKELARANDIRDPTRHLKAGTKVKIPEL